MSVRNRRRIRELPLFVQPGYRLSWNGAEHLSTAELLALLLQAGDGGRQLAPVAVAIVTARAARQLQNRVVIETFQVFTATQLLSEPGHGGGETVAVGSLLNAGLDGFFQYRRFD